MKDTPIVKNCKCSGVVSCFACKFKRLTDRHSINTTIYNNFLCIFAQDRIVDNGQKKFTFMDNKGTPWNAKIGYWNQITFYKKDPAIEFNKLLGNHLSLFSIDIDSGGKKKFILATKKTMFKMLDCYQNVYENYGDDQKLKLFLDIDIKPVMFEKFKDKATGKINTNQCFEHYISESMKVVGIELLKRYGINKTKHMVLRSEEEFDEDGNARKVSGHIIYLDVIFKNIEHMKYFFMGIESQLITDKIIDPSNYCVGCIRTIWAKKMSRQNVLKFHPKYSNYQKVNDERTFIDSLITDVEDNEEGLEIEKLEELKDEGKVIQRCRKEAIVQKIHMNGTSLRFTCKFLRKILELFNKNRCECYKDWIEVGMALKNTNPASFVEWRNWSMASGKFTAGECAYKWNSFRRNGFGPASLMYWASIDNPEKYGEITKGMRDRRLFNSEPIVATKLIDPKTKFIYRELDSIKGDMERQLFINNVVKWHEETGFKTLAIKSGYGSGKTSFVHRYIDYYNPRRILWITHRQSLKDDIFGKFRDFHFADYQDKMFWADRLICQQESLPKILNDYCFDNDGELPSYDLIIVDEIESLLKHFDSDTFKGANREVFELMRGILINSKKILALDGDFDNRAYWYLKSFGDMKIIENICRQGPKNFIFMDNKTGFENEIDEAIKKGENVVIICMSSAISEHYLKKYEKMGIKCVLHNKNTDDELKKQLKTVNEFWKGFQLVIYSPTIESGVSFDDEHFDKLFAVLCDKSTTPRGFLQMCFRVRHIKDSGYRVFTNGMPYKEKARFYTFDETKLYCDEVFRTSYKKEYRYDPIKNKMVFGIKYDLFDQIMVYNKQEELNKHKHYFIPYLIKLLREKGHTITKEGPLRYDRIKRRDIMKEEVLEAADCTGEEFKVLIGRQNENKATRKDKVMIEKHVLKRTFGIDKLSEDFMDKFYRKEEQLYNLFCLVSQENIQYVDGFNMEKNLNVSEQRLRVGMINELLTGLGFNGIFDKGRIALDNFQKNLEESIKKCEVFNTPTAGTLFNISVDGIRFKEVPTIDDFLKVINKNILMMFGIKIKNKWVRTKIKKKMGYKKEICIIFKNGINEFLLSKSRRDKNIAKVSIIDTIKIMQWKELFN